MVVEDFNPQYGEDNPVPVNFRQGHGTTIADLERDLAEHGICYPVDGDMTRRERHAAEVAHDDVVLRGAHWIHTRTGLARMAADALAVLCFEEKRSGWLPIFEMRTAIRPCRPAPATMNRAEVERYYAHNIEHGEVYAVSYRRF